MWLTKCWFPLHFGFDQNEYWRATCALTGSGKSESLGARVPVARVEKYDTCGTAISARFGIPPSPALGELMKVLKDRVDNGDLEAQRDNDYYLEYLAAEKLVTPR